MAYGLMTDFIFDVGDGVGEFLSDDDKAQFTPLNLEEIVEKYIDERNLLNVVFLKKQIRNYIKRHMGPEGLEYAHPPFGQDTSFVEDYFEGDLYTFLTQVLTLLDVELKARRRNIFSRLAGRG